jgi:hypothetical protein
MSNLRSTSRRRRKQRQASKRRASLAGAVLCGNMMAWDTTPREIAGRNSPRSGAFGLQILTPGGRGSQRNPHVLPRVLCLPSTAVGLRAEPLVFRVHSRLRPFAFLPLLEPTSGAGTTSFCPCCRGMGAISTAPRMARAPIISRICPSRTTAGDTR